MINDLPSKVDLMCMWEFVLMYYLTKVLMYVNFYLKQKLCQGQRIILERRCRNPCLDNALTVFVLRLHIVEERRLLCPYMPDRILHQFGNVQWVPLQILNIPPPSDEVDSMWLHYHMFVVQLTQPASYPAETSDGYEAWYQEHSHPLKKPPASVSTYTHI